MNTRMINNHNVNSSDIKDKEERKCWSCVKPKSEIGMFTTGTILVVYYL